VKARFVTGQETLSASPGSVTASPYCPVISWAVGRSDEGRPTAVTDSARKGAAAKLGRYSHTNQLMSLCDRRREYYIRRRRTMKLSARQPQTVPCSTATQGCTNRVISDSSIRPDLSISRTPFVISEVTIVRETMICRTEPNKKRLMKKLKIKTEMLRRNGRV